MGGSCSSSKAVPCRSAGGPVVQGRAGRKLKETNAYAFVCDVQHDVAVALVPDRPLQALIFAPSVNKSFIALVARSPAFSREPRPSADSSFLVTDFRFSRSLITRVDGDSLRVDDLVGLRCCIRRLIII